MSTIDGSGEADTCDSRLFRGPKKRLLRRLSSICRQQVGVLLDDGFLSEHESFGAKSQTWILSCLRILRDAFRVVLVVEPVRYEYKMVNTKSQTTQWRQ